MENSYLFIRERESQNWILHSRLPNKSFKIEKKKTSYAPNYIFPKPEHVSPFIETHKIIKANTEEEAWQNLNSK